jgi:hypothetical protein
MIMNSEPKRSRKKKVLITILVSLLAILVVFRLLLPGIVLKYVNKKLNNLSEYWGNVKDIDIRFYRGAYIIKDINLLKIDKKGQITDTIPFFKASSIDLSVEWGSLFKGVIVGKIYIHDPVVNFAKGKHENEDVSQDTTDFQQLIVDLIPLTINRFEVDNGQIHFLDVYSNPKIDIYAKDIHIVATNLTNVVDKNKLLPASLDVGASVYDGQFNLQADFNALKKYPTFEMKMQMENLGLANLNEFLKAYGNFDVERGNLSIFSEFAAKEGNFGGYVKPFVKDFKVKKWNDQDFKQIVWETLVGTSMKILQNKKSNEVATKVPLNGTFSNPGINIWRAISNVLRNAFISALRPTLDNTININKLSDVKGKTFLEKVFGGKNDKKSNDKKEKKK